MRGFTRCKRVLVALAAVGGVVLVPVADAGRGIVNGDTGALVAALPGVSDVAARSGGGLWVSTGAGEDPEDDTGQGLWRVSGSSTTLVANLFEYEEKFNPHPATVDSNPLDVADAGGGKAVVADAGGNDLLLIGDGNNANGDVASRVKVVATFPDQLVSTAYARSCSTVSPRSSTSRSGPTGG